MSSTDFSLKIVLILTIGFSLASLLGYFSHRAKLSPILGYLLAGYLIGPYSPGYEADVAVAEQLAEIGVILMMFRVGLHFKQQDLFKVKYIAIPGAIGQTVITTAVVACIVYAVGWFLESGILFGLAIGVASTVVLVRVLTDFNLLKTLQGHISVGWLIVEDMITVVALVLVPTLAILVKGAEISVQDLIISIIFVLLKFALLIGIVFTIGRRIIKYLLSKVEVASHELFILTILAITFLIAAGSTMLLGISIALGAFIAGMVVGQTHVRHKVSVNTAPLQDVFVVIFFLSIGMLFNPRAIAEHFALFISTLAIILILKPLIAFIIVLTLKYPLKIALTVAVALAQVGEFSFILTEQAMRYKILPQQGFDIIVACSLISISMNPLLFKAFNLTKTELG